MKYDVAIIGGGPAGMMAAISAAQRGAKVILLEKNNRLGVKLLLTGHGRCNVTNKTSDTNVFINAFGANGRFLHSALNNFSIDDVINFFEERGVPLKTEEHNRVFPKSDRGLDILNALKKELEKLQVEIHCDASVKQLKLKDKAIIAAILQNKEEISSNKYIICCGGKSYPETGSAGDGFALAQSVGHTITPLFPGLTPLILNEKDIKQVEGVSLSNIEAKISLKNKFLAKNPGDIIFTRNGVSGPAIISLSQLIASQISLGPVLHLDLFPTLNKDELNKKLLTLLTAEPNKRLQTNLSNLLPERFISYILGKNDFNSTKTCNTITATERRSLVDKLKDDEYYIKDLEGFDKAMVTVGGVSLKEVDPKTMQSKIIKNLYFAGEVLDLAGRTGGFNLQACWSTGYTAGQNAAE